MQITPEAFQRYLRIAIQWLSGSLVTYGLATPESSYLPILSGALMFVGSFLWTLYGNRVQAKINEVAAMGSDPTSPVKGILIEQSIEGRALATTIANANPDAVIALSGTHAAAQMASSSTTSMQPTSINTFAGETK